MLIKIFLVVILVVIAMYLYRRTQVVAKQELDKSTRTTKVSEAQSEVASHADTAQSDSVEAPAAVTDSSEVDTTINQDNDTPIEPEISPAESVEVPAVKPEMAEPHETKDVAPAVAQATQAEVTEPEAIVTEAIATEEIDTEKAEDVKTAQLNKDEAPTAAPQVEADENQGHQLSLTTVKGEWASDSFVQLVAVANTASDAQAQHDALANVINHCYKMRKQSDYCQYGAALKLAYLDLFRVVYQQHVANDNAQDIKAPAFMQLSTLLNDIGEFGQAISVCQQAIEYHLTDGTVTGFEGRINRIEKAQAKAG
ncbi:hypothetical protein ACROAE_07570 [Shewanella sp. MF05960]|uniref:hypothetical protein n=1 Tax=Shewanella sp. MF05960 TaxID=3434874 RepID=UPI003D78F8BF